MQTGSDFPIEVSLAPEGKLKMVSFFNSAARPARRWIPLLFALALLLTLLFSARPLLEQQHSLPFGLNRIDDSQWSVHDFASLFGYSRAIVTGQIHHPYRFEDHLLFMKQWSGCDLGFSFPYAYSPTFWLVLLPLMPFPTPMAFCLWTILPVFFGFFLIRKKGPGDSGVSLPFIAVAICSGTYLGCVQLGQTSIWALLILSLLCFRPNDGWISGLLLFLLSAKPPLFIAAAMALFWSRQWKTVAFALALGGIEGTIVTLFLGSGWIKDYIHLLTHYDAASPDGFHHLQPHESMSNLRNFLVSSGSLPDLSASSLALKLWIGSLILVSAALLICRQPVCFPASLSLGLMLYLALFPHVTFTEDLLLALPLFMWIKKSRSTSAQAGVAILLAIFLNMGIHKGILPFLWATQLIFLGKIIVLLFGTATLWIHRHEPDC